VKTTRFWLYRSISLDVWTQTDANSPTHVNECGTVTCVTAVSSTEEMTDVWTGPYIVINLYLSGSPIRSSPTKKKGKHLIPVYGPHVAGTPTYNGGATWFPKGIVYDTAISTPVPRSLQHDTFHLGLGRPEPLLSAGVVAALIRVCPPHCYRLTRDPGQSRVRIHESLR
jgi:hypothetical protein